MNKLVHTDYIQTRIDRRQGHLHTESIPGSDDPVPRSQHSPPPQLELNIVLNSYSELWVMVIVMITIVRSEVTK
jgi:hypothetical protein